MARILIVDDDSDTRELVCRYVEKAGHETVSASNGWEALLALDGLSVDLILLDVMMPGMDGETFLRILRNAQRQSDTPVVIISAMGRESVERRLARLQVADILPKSDHFFADLPRVVSRHLHLNDTPHHN